MRDVQRISDLQAFLLTFATALCSNWFHFPPFAYNAFGRSGWLVASVGGVAVGLLGARFLLDTGLRYPDQTLGAYAPRLLGPVLGYPLAAAAVVYFVFETAYGARLMADIERAALLPRTSPVVMLVLILGTATFATYQGPVVIARLTEMVALTLLLPIQVLLLVGPAFLPVESVHVLPLLEPPSGPTALADAAAPLFTYRSFVTWAAWLPHLVPARAAPRVVNRALWCMVPVMMTAAAYPLLIFGWPAANVFRWPFWQVITLLRARLIPLERLVLLVEIVIEAMFVITVSVFLYSAAALSRDLLGLRSHRGPSLAIAGAALAVAALLFDDPLQHEALIQYWLAGGFLFWIVVFGAVWVVARARGRRHAA